MTRSIARKGRLRYILSRLQKKSTLSAVLGSEIDPASKVEPGSQVVGSSMGRHSFCGYDCVLLSVDIGSFCSIADQVYIGGSAHPMHFVSTSPVFLSHRDSVKTKFSRHDFYDMPRTTVGNDVWIGYGARIRAGISIGHGAVIGMGAIVTRDVAPYTVIGGNPGREISRRFPEDIAEALLRSEWWNYDDEELKAAAALFTDPRAFLESRGLL